jgi:large subunit ribosomal protein L10
MALSKAQKNDMVAGYQAGLAEAPHAFVLGYQGISVPQVTELRAKIRESGGQYQVVKNTLVKLAIEGKALDSVKDVFEGPVAVVYTEDSVVELAKALTEFAKTAPVLQFKGGVVQGQPVAPEQIKDIAELPTREELLAKLLFLLQSPVTRLVRDLADFKRQFVAVLGQVAQQKQAS